MPDETDDEQMTWEKMPRVPCARCGYTGRLMNFAGFCAKCWADKPVEQRAALRGRDVEILEKEVRVEVRTEVLQPIDNTKYTHETVYKPVSYWRVILVSLASGAVGAAVVMGVML